MSTGPRNPQQQRTATPNANHGSVTTTQAGPSAPFNFSGTLRLRAASDAQLEQEPSNSRRIQWADDVIDNEGMGKKSSKVCCIYHKPREAGESSSEDSSSSSSDSDSEPDTSRAQPANRRSRRRNPHRDHDHNHQDPDESCEHQHSQSGGDAKGKQPERKRSPNAYERVPKKKQPKEPKS